MASTSLKSDSESVYDTKSLLEQWMETNVDDEYDPYNDDSYAGHDMFENLQAICDDWCYFFGMTSGREYTPPSGFSTLTQLPNTNTNDLPSIIASTLTTRSHPVTHPLHRASTLANPEPVISPAFIEANFKTLESLMKDYRRQAQDEGFQRELEYSSEEYDEEIEAKPRPPTDRQARLALWIGSPVTRRTSERIVGFEGISERAPNDNGRLVEKRRGEVS
ncbi:hypothetical protein Tco_0454045 [Tanacetum coccineum]